MSVWNGQYGVPPDLGAVVSVAARARTPVP